MLCDKCKKAIKQDYPGFYEVVVNGKNFSQPFSGLYFFHYNCWDSVWLDFIKEESIDKEVKRTQGEKNETSKN